MNNILIRPESHEIDTLARRKVPFVFPKSWEHRELTGRDYGIDMIIELFEEGCATGTFLILQIKGTSVKIENRIKELKFDIPVRTLIYSELFIAPVLLVVCPINLNPIKFYYLWLQEYIRVVLNHDRPTWRNNKATIRVSIPVNNYMPGNEKHLFFIANFPNRLFDWTQLARICMNIKFYESKLLETPEIDYVILEKVINLLEEAKNLKSIFGDQNWKWSNYMRKNVIEPGLEAANLILTNSSCDKFKARIKLYSCIESLIAGLSVNNDYRYSNLLWETKGDCNF